MDFQKYIFFIGGYWNLSDIVYFFSPIVFQFCNCLFHFLVHRVQVALHLFHIQLLLL